MVAATDVKVAVLGIRMFRTLLREFPELAEQLLVGLAGELRKAQAAVQEAAIRTDVATEPGSGT